MCRYNQLWGLVLISFGVGVLIGQWLEGGFLSHCFGIGVILIGCAIGKKK